MFRDDSGQLWTKENPNWKMNKIEKIFSEIIHNFK